MQSYSTNTVLLTIDILYSTEQFIKPRFRHRMQIHWHVTSGGSHSQVHTLESAYTDAFVKTIFIINEGRNSFTFLVWWTDTAPLFPSRVPYGSVVFLRRDTHTLLQTAVDNQSCSPTLLRSVSIPTAAFSTWSFSPHQMLTTLFPSSLALHSFSSSPWSNSSNSYFPNILIPLAAAAKLAQAAAASPISHIHTYPCFS